MAVVGGAASKTAVAAFEAHVDHVRRAIPEDRLLVFEHGLGWGPLCGFLGVDRPDMPCPFGNASTEFRRNNIALEEGPAP